MQLLAGWSCCVPVCPVCNVFSWILPFSFFSFCNYQNYFKDGWNIFDCVTVLGSITDILVTELGVSKKKKTHKRRTWKYANTIYYQWLRGHSLMSEDLCICAIVLRQTESTTMMSGRTALAFVSFTAQSCTNGSWKSYINVPVGETRRQQSQAGQHWAKDSEAEGRSPAAVNQWTTSASFPWQPVKSLSSSAWCR